MVVPDTVSALDALERLKADALGLALVFDEHGSFEGVITAADVLEAIVGDASELAIDRVLSAAAKSEGRRGEGSTIKIR